MVATYWNIAIHNVAVEICCIAWVGLEQPDDPVWRHRPAFGDAGVSGINAVDMAKLLDDRSTCVILRP